MGFKREEDKTFCSFRIEQQHEQRNRSTIDHRNRREQVSVHVIRAHAKKLSASFYSSMKGFLYVNLLRILYKIIRIFSLNLTFTLNLRMHSVMGGFSTSTIQFISRLTGTDHS